MALKLKNVDIINPPLSILKGLFSPPEFAELEWRYDVLKQKGASFIQSPFSLKVAYPVGGSKTVVSNTALLIAKGESPFSLEENCLRFANAIHKAFAAMEEAIGYGVLYSGNLGSDFGKLGGYFGLCLEDVAFLAKAGSGVLLDGISHEQALGVVETQPFIGVPVHIIHSYPFHKTGTNYYAAGKAPLPAMKAWVEKNYHTLPAPKITAANTPPGTGVYPGGAVVGEALGKATNVQFSPKVQALPGWKSTMAEVKNSLIQHHNADVLAPSPMQHYAETAAKVLAHQDKIAKLKEIAEKLSKNPGSWTKEELGEATKGPPLEEVSKKQLDSPMTPMEVPVALKDASYLCQKVKGTTTGDYRVVALGPRVKLAARIKPNQVSIRAEWKAILNTKDTGVLKDILQFHGDYASLHLTTTDAQTGKPISPYRVLGAVLSDLCARLDIKITLPAHHLKEVFNDGIN